MIQYCIITYIIVEIFEGISAYTNIRQDKQNITRFQRNVYSVSILVSYTLTILLGVLGIYCVYTYLGLENEVAFIIGLILAFWIRDIIDSVIIRKFIAYQYKARLKYYERKVMRGDKNERTRKDA